jgi:hypothetical protein
MKLGVAIMLVLLVLGYRTFQFEYTNDGWSLRFWKPAPPPPKNPWEPKVQREE